MKIERAAARTMSNPPESTFTGDVKIGGYFKRGAPSRLVSATVHFAPGSRTPWKVNPIGQTLIILSGRGWVQAEGETVVEVKAGDIVWCPAGERHWEGATPEQSMRYFAVQEEVEGETVSFGDTVTDTEYQQGRSGSGLIIKG